MKKIFFLVFILSSFIGFSQSGLYLRSDTVFIMKGSSPYILSGNNELNLFNGTRTRNGAFLQNYNNGRTRFAYAVDSVWRDGDSLVIRRGDTTIKINVGSGGGGSMVYPGAGIPISTGSAWGTSITGTAGQLFRRNLANTDYEFFTPSYVTSNIYTADGTLVGNRTVNANFNNFTINNANNINLGVEAGENITLSNYNGVNPLQTVQLTPTVFLWNTDTVATRAYARSVGGGGSLLVKSEGTGQDLWYDLADDTLRIKRIVADPYIKVTTSSDSTIHIGLDSVKLRDSIRAEIADTAAAIRADMGSGIVLSGTYGPGGDVVMWIDTTINRIAYKVGSVIFHAPITDSIDATNYDADAQAYIDDVNATDVTLTVEQKQAINDYILGLKSDGLWSLIYDQGIPVWGTAASSAVSLKTTHTTTWVNSPTFASDGVVGNGTNQYGNLGFSPSAAGTQNSLHFGVYVQTNATTASVLDMAVTTSGTGACYLNTKAGAANSFAINSTTLAAGNIPSSAGMTIINRELSTHQDFYKNGSLITHDATASTGIATNNFFIMAYDVDGSPSNYSSRKISLWTAGSGLTATQAANLSTRINQLMTDLGINVY